MIFASDTRLLAVAGIVYALAGAAILCQTAFATLPLRNSKQASDRQTDISRIEQGMDVRVASCLLALGFFLQIVGTLGTATLNGPAALLLIGLALGLIYYAMMRSNLAENFVVSQPQIDSDALVSLPVVAPVVDEPASNLVELRPIKAAENAG